jgi:DNA-binding NarL/FixJ family response regulator
MPKEQDKAIQTIKVLLVEDHLLTRIGLKTVMERTADIKIVGEAENGEQAVEKANELRPDIILMDVGMPVMDGIEAAKLIRDKLPETQVIMLTSHDNDRDIFASLSAGASGYCLKDVMPDRLYAAIRSVHEGDVWLDSTIAKKVMRDYSGRPSAPQAAPASPQKAAAQPVQSVVTSMPNLPEPLSARELEVLALVVEGLSNQGIADRLIISLATAKTHVRNILNKLAVDDRTQAAVHAMRRGLV